MTDQEINTLLRFVSSADPTPDKTITYRRDSAILDTLPRGTYKLKKDAPLSNALALIVQRNEIFGPFFRYPKTLIIAPEFFQMESLFTSKIKDYENTLHRRDYERLIYITQKKDKSYCIHCVQFFLNLTTPDSAKGRMIVFYTKDPQIANQTEWARGEVGEVKINGNFLFKTPVDGYNIKAEPRILAVNDESQIRQTISIVDFLARNSGDIWTQLYLDAMTKALSIPDANSNLLAEKIGIFPYTSPLDKEQTKRPVPVGEVTPDRLVEISKIIKDIRNPKMIKSIETPVYSAEEAIETPVYNYSSEESDLI
jgi:hypothetical protein